MTNSLKIMCWNIAEGSDTGAGQPNCMLNQIADQISSKRPDIVLLNEVKNWDIWIGGGEGDHIIQTSRIAELTGLPYYVDFGVNRTGWTGHKAVSILSRYDLKDRIAHPVPRIPWQIENDFGTVEATIIFDGKEIHIFSTRFCPIHWKSETDLHDNPDELAKNIAGHKDALKIIQGLNQSVPIIFGGDFNADMDRPHFASFVQNSDLTRAVYDGVDNIFYRGPFKVTYKETCYDCWDHEPRPQTSDHSWLFVELLANSDSQPDEPESEIPTTNSVGFRNIRDGIGGEQL